MKEASHVKNMQCSPTNKNTVNLRKGEEDETALGMEASN
jgi:hypothetical protein